MLYQTEGVVEELERDEPDIQQLRVAVPQTRHALAYPALTGRVRQGDRVLLNTAAVELGLGTGGFDMVAALLHAAPLHHEAPGHIMKLRYTPCQIPVAAVEAQESPNHEALTHPARLHDVPVVCCELHSQLAAVCFGAHESARLAGCRPPRVICVYTEGAALAAWFSKLLPLLKAEGLLQCVITAGQAVGGDLEAVSLFSALQAAVCIASATLIVTVQGPGNAGTGTPLGFSGIEQGVALNAAASLGARPIAALRQSMADPRPRHQGVSHHSITVLEQVTLAPVEIALPAQPADALQQAVQALQRACLLRGHRLQTVECEPQWQSFLQAALPVSTMGRTPAQDPQFFRAALAAGVLAQPI